MVRLIFWMLILLTSCSSLEKWAVRRASPVFYQAGEQLTKEDSWEFFKVSAPGNLKLVEALYLTNPENLKLLPAVIKAYAGYAYAVPETLAFEDELKGVDSPHRQEAIHLYTRALDYGVFYLGKRGVSQDDLLALPEDKLLAKLDAETDEDDLVAIVYMAQSWGSLINLQKDNVALVSQIPRVKLLFDHVCKLKPDLENNMCDIFTAQYEASRPRMVGGSPEKARALYEQAMKKNPHHLLIPLNLIQFVYLPAMEEDAYEQLATTLRAEFAEWGKKNRENLKDESRYSKHRDLNLYNAIAKKRFDIIEQNKKKIF